MSSQPPIVGTSQSVDGADITGVDQAGIYRAIAREFLSAASDLANCAAGHPRAVAHLCAHALEVALKSVLVGTLPDRVIRFEVGHDLRRAWVEARTSGRTLGQMSTTLEVLSDVHAAPYHTRYQPGAQASVWPIPADLVAEVRGALVTLGVATP